MNKFFSRGIFCVFFAAMAVLSFNPAINAKAEESDVIVEEYTSISEEAQELLADNDVLFAEYVEEAFANLTTEGSTVSHKRGDRLTGREKNFYDTMALWVKQVAAGEIEDLDFNISVAELFKKDVVWHNGCQGIYLSAEDLGLDYIVDADGNLNPKINKSTFYDLLFDFSYENAVIALMIDYPYEMYWFDKAQDVSMSLGGGYRDYTEDSIFVPATGYMCLYFYATDDYAKDGNSYWADTTKTAATSTAVANAQKVISDASSKSDYEKLNYYRQWICDNTDYNNAAAGQGKKYGDPWQLIYVFDNDASTKVVCEGYAKAFQYLCDNTDFYSDDIYCLTVNGVGRSGSGSGSHMWNIVHMEDGYNYINDITWCDGSGGDQDQFFLVGAISGSVKSGYKVNYYDSYQYSTSNGMELYQESELQIKIGDRYTPPVEVEKTECRFEGMKLVAKNGYFGVALRMTLPSAIAKGGEINGNAHVWLINRTEVYSTEMTCKDYTSYDKENDFYEFYVTLEPKMINDEFIIIVEDNSNNKIVINGVEPSTEYEISIIDYLNSIINDEKEDECIVNFAKAIKYYGLCADAYFAGSDSVVDRMNLPSCSFDSYSAINNSFADGINYIGTSLVLESGVSIRHYFIIDGDYSDRWGSGEGFYFVDSSNGERLIRSSICEVEEFVKQGINLVYIEYTYYDYYSLMDRAGSVTLFEGDVPVGTITMNGIGAYCKTALNCGNESCATLVESLYLYIQMYNELIKAKAAA